MFAIARNGFLTGYDGDRVGLAPSALPFPRSRRASTAARSPRQCARRPRVWSTATARETPESERAIQVAELSLRELLIWW